MLHTAASPAPAPRRPSAAPATPTSRLWQPRLSLTACVRGVMSRSTVGVDLADSQRFNHFPASPLCSISWWFTGHSEYLAPGGAVSLATPRSLLPAGAVFGGPHSRPTVSWNPGEVHAIMLLLLPDALHRLIGLDTTPWLNRLVPVSQVLPALWLAMCEAVQVAPSEEARLQCIEQFLDPLWQAARPRQAFNGQRYQDWAEGLALRAATSAPGRSLRQIERRIKQWAGQPLRELRGLGRAERAFFEGLAADERGELNWADVAAQSGYADQSHLCRESRRVTGFSPQELRRGIAEDEAFWSYRLWQ